MSGAVQTFDALNLGMSGDFLVTVNGDGTKTLSGHMSMANVWDFMWTLTTNLDPFVTLHTVITNTNASTQTFGVATSASVFPPITPSSRMGGDIHATVYDLNSDGSASLSAPTTGAIYDARIDGTSVKTMIPPGNGLTYSGTPGGSASFVIPPTFGMPGITDPGPAVNSSIGIVDIFQLSGGDKVSAG